MKGEPYLKPESFAALIRAINSDSERELESAVLAITKAVKRKPSPRRTAARKPS